jgi:hypothetical protein
VRARREKRDIGWKERKEGVECAIGRERERERPSSACRMDVAK